MYHICYAWNPERKAMDWGIHDGVAYIKHGFKTRKAAREWCDQHGLQYSK